MSTSRRRYRKLIRTKRKRAERAMSREANFFHLYLYREKYFPVGTFKDWWISPLRGMLEVLIGSYYRADRIAQIMYSDNPMFKLLPK